MSECSISNIGACFRDIRDWVSGKLNDIKRDYRKLAAHSPISDDDCRTYDYDRPKATSVGNPTEPLRPLTDFIGVSTGGVNTAIAIPKMNITLDAGPAIADLEMTDRIFISHTDGDHIHGLDTVMCESIRKDEPIEIFISENARPYVEQVREKMIEKNDGIKVNFNFVKPGDTRRIDDNTRYEFFNVIHTPTSIGLGVHKPDSDGIWKRVLTYTGDISLKEMFERGLVEKTPALWDTETLVIETSITPMMQKTIPFISLARARHSSVGDVKRVVDYSKKRNGAGIGNIVAMHVLGLPPFVLRCKTIGEDLMSHFWTGSQGVSFLSTCYEFGKKSGDKKSRTLDDPKPPHPV